MGKGSLHPNVFVGLWSSRFWKDRTPHPPTPRSHTRLVGIVVGASCLAVIHLVRRTKTRQKASGATVRSYVPEHVRKKGGPELDLKKMSAQEHQRMAPRLTKKGEHRWRLSKNQNHLNWETLLRQNTAKTKIPFWQGLKGQNRNSPRGTSVDPAIKLGRVKRVTTFK